MRLGAVKPKVVETVKPRIEQIVACLNAGVPYDADLTQWINGLSDQLRRKLAAASLLESRNAARVIGLRELLAAFIARSAMSQSLKKAHPLVFTA